MFCCAFDLGASGGRVIVGEYDGRLIKLTEIHRFPNEPVYANGVLYWDVLRLFHELKTGLKKIAAEKIPLSAVGIDTWGVDYALLDERGQLLGNPVHYRDSRTDAFSTHPSIDLRGVYTRTGIQHMQINTLFQLMAEAETRPGLLREAHDLLFIPDLFTYYLTGQKINEYTIASTSQLVDAKARDWDETLLSGLKPGGLKRLFKPVTQPCTPVGVLSGEVCAETGLDPSVLLVAVGSHDTASAVAGTPMPADCGHAYLSCGTWSLLGAERDAPCLTQQAFDKNFTNEGGLNGRIRLLKNINGLWMMQRLLRAFNDKRTGGPKLDFGDMIREAETSLDAPFAISPNDPSFTNPPDMADAVSSYCVRTGQGTPRTMGETIMAVYNGMTREYAATLADLESVTDEPVHTLHMVGGGVRDTLLCRLTAKAIGRRVEAGPVEASALGNIAAQLIGLGAVKDLTEGREIIRRSFEPIVYE